VLSAAARPSSHASHGVELQGRIRHLVENLDANGNTFTDLLPNLRLLRWAAVIVTVLVVGMSVGLAVLLQ